MPRMTCAVVLRPVCDLHRFLRPDERSILRLLLDSRGGIGIESQLTSCQLLAGRVLGG